MSDRLNPVGWGFRDAALDADEVRRLVRTFSGFFDLGKAERRQPPSPEHFELPPPRAAAPAACATFARADTVDRLLHAAGRSYRDLVGLRGGKLAVAPDWVAHPRDLADLRRVLEVADRERLAVIPFGGGTSVVGGVTPEVPDGFSGVVSLDTRGLDRVLDVDVRDRVVHAEAGILGPDLEAALKPHGLAIRHFPQSYFHATLGGWVAARGAGHFSTLHAKIEDRVQALKMVTPSGMDVETRPLPAGSVFVDANRLVAGSEGAFGVIADVRLRAVALPAHRADASLEFVDFPKALEAGRALVQAGFWPTQLRILDPFERMVSALTVGQAPRMQPLMLLSFESDFDSVAERCAAAVRLAESLGGTSLPKTTASGEPGAEAWKSSFFRQPYMRDVLIDFGVVVDTFETAIPWSGLPAFYDEVRAATLAALQRVCGGGGVLCRVTHAYPDGVALYFSLYGLGRHGELVDQWWEVKRAAADAVERLGGTASHHHAMGRDHRDWAFKEFSPGSVAALRGIKAQLDPRGIMNPGLCR